MRSKLVLESSEDWRCALCCHVRTGTVLLGLWHLILHILALSIIAVVLIHPELLCKKGGDDGGISKVTIFHTDPNDIHIYDYNHNEYAIFRERKLNAQDIHVGLAITLCTFFITLMMVYGAVKGKPSYLMPFFCLQVLDFCIATLTVIGYFSYMPDLRRAIEDNQGIPFRQQLLKLDQQWLSLVVLLGFVGFMMFKAYFIGVVWSCYKYLVYRNNRRESITHYIDHDTQILLPPNYEAAIKDPKYLSSYDPTLAPATVSQPPPYTPRAQEVI